MTNHVHLLVTPPECEDSLPRTMQSLGRRYVRYINTTYRRSGTLWEGRYRAAPIDSDASFLACCRYIELNPGARRDGGGGGGIPAGLVQTERLTSRRAAVGILQPRAMQRVIELIPNPLNPGEAVEIAA